MTTARISTAILATGALLVTGCAAQLSQGDAPVSDPTTSAGVPDDYAGRFRAFGTVLENPEHGPQICHVVLDSYPPQCDGPDLVGWDWSAVEHESAGSSRWGGYVLVGTFEGETFTLTEPAVVDDGSIERPHGDDPEFGTPCPEPAGGWTPVDPARATQLDLERASQIAQAADGYGGLWVDQRWDGSEPVEADANNPQRLVLNVSTTGDVAALQDALREVWGGSLCVSRAVRDEATLLEIQRDLGGYPDVLTSAPDILTGQLVVQVFVATPALQQTYDQRYGADTVRLEGVLVPID